MPLDKNMSHDEMVKELMHSYYKNGKIGNTEPRGVEHALKIANAVAYNIERSKDVQEIEEGIKEMSLSDLLNQFESLYLNEQNEEINPEDTKFDRELLYGYAGGKLELAMDRDMVAKICHSGSNADEVDEVKEMPEIRKQLDAIPEEDLDELKHHLDMNQAEFDSLTRPELESYLVWIAAWNIFEDEEYSKLFETDMSDMGQSPIKPMGVNKAKNEAWRKSKYTSSWQLDGENAYAKITALTDNGYQVKIWDNSTNKTIGETKTFGTKEEAMKWAESQLNSKINEISDDTVYNAVAKSYQRTKASKENNSPDLIKNVMKFNSLNNKGLRRAWKKAGLEDPRGMSTKELSKKWDKEYVPVHAEYDKKVRDRINKSKLGETLNSFENFLNENSASKQSYKGYTIYNTDKDTVFVNKLNGGYNVWSFGNVVKNPKNIIDNIKDYENEGGSTFVKTQDELKKELEEFGITESINEISNELVGKVHDQRKRNWIKDAEAVSQAMKKRFEKNPNYKPDKELQDLENKEGKSWNKLMKNSELAKSKKLYKLESQINEISDKLASKVVSKRMKARKAELDKLNDMSADVNKAQADLMRTQPNSPEAIKAQDDYDTKMDNYRQALDNDVAGQKANKLFKTVRKRGERLNRKGADYDYFYRLKRKGDKLGEISNESLKEDMNDTKILSASYSFTGPDQYRPEEYGTCSFYKTPENKYYFVDERDEDKSELYNSAIDALYFADDYFNEIYDYFSWDEEFIELRRFMKEN